jgi:hypothetical protein
MAPRRLQCSPFPILRRRERAELDRMKLEDDALLWNCGVKPVKAFDVDRVALRKSRREEASSARRCAATELVDAGRRRHRRRTGCGG